MSTIALIFAIAIGVVLGVCLGAGMLWLACRIVLKWVPSFGQCVRAVLYCIAVAIPIALVITLIVGAPETDQGSLRLNLILSTVMVFVGAKIFQKVLTGPEGERMSYGLGIVIAIVQIVIQMMLSFGIGFILGMAQLAN